MRLVQPEGKRGSLKWIQRLVGKYPRVLDIGLQKAGALSASHQLNWLSPIHKDQWAEYRDSRFLHTIGQAHLIEALKGFWPRRGPQWDALAKDESGRVFLFEAKAHGAEMTSSCQAGATSLQVISRSINTAKLSFGASPDSDWLNGYYQYANRLAQLSFLQQHGVDAWLVFLYFTGDLEMKGPASAADWSPFIQRAQAHLGLTQHPKGVATTFLDVSILE
jgi:hypothetical protein